MNISACRSALTALIDVVSKLENVAIPIRRLYFIFKDLTTLVLQSGNSQLYGQF